MKVKNRYVVSVDQGDKLILYYMTPPEDTEIRDNVCEILTVTAAAERTDCNFIDMIATDDDCAHQGAMLYANTFENMQLISTRIAMIDVIKKLNAEVEKIDRRLKSLWDPQLPHVLREIK